MLETKLNILAIKDQKIVPIATSDVNMSFEIGGIKTYADMKDGHMPEWSQCPNGLTEEYSEWSYSINTAPCKWDIDRKEEGGVVKWFIGDSESQENKHRYKAFLATRQDVDQYNHTGLPQEMNGAWNQKLTFDFQGEKYYTNFVLGQYGESNWQVFKHLVVDVAKDVFKDAVMEELGVEEQIAQTISAFDDASDAHDVWKGVSDRSWYLHVYSDIAEVRKIMWYEKDSGKPTIITPLIKESDNTASDDYYVLFKVSTEDSFDVIITKLNF